MLEKISAIMVANPALCLVGVLILIFAALGAGYVIGNNIYNRKASEEVHDAIEKLRYEGAVRSSIIDNVNLGVLAYSSEGLLYKNRTIREFEDFIRPGEHIPQTMDEFLQRFDNGNHLKSNYLLNVENESGDVRANYIDGKHIYEIKIIHRLCDTNRLGDNGRLDMVIVDDITQIKDDERRQKDLAANVSHELKTPLTVIRASEFFVKNITPDKMPSYEELIKWGTRIANNAVRMQDIVQDFLILSMCSSNVQMNIVDIGEVIHKAVNSLSDYPGRANVDIRIPNNMYFPLVFGNANLLMRVIINLLTNAIKYIDFEGKQEPHEIKLNISGIGERIAIEVSDNGRGIPQKDISHLFERFFRVDNSGSRDVGGSGIGLAIARDIADMHDATITVVSELGRGSAFTLVIPQAQGAFRNVFEDAQSGVVSEEPYYRNAAEFMALQAVEAARSMGYDDLLDSCTRFEAIGSNDKESKDRALTELLRKMGDERYMDLVEELTYIEPEFDDDEEDSDDFDDGFSDDSDDSLASDADGDSGYGELHAHNDAILENHAAIETGTAEQPCGEDEEIRRKKEEARKLLTQTILPRAVPNGGGISLQNDEKSKEKVTIHPLFEDSMYNKNEAVADTEIRSAVRKVLDETAPLPAPSGNDMKDND